MIDALILKSMCSRNVYERLHDSIPKDMLSPDTLNMLSWIKLYFQTYTDSAQLNWSTFNSLISVRGTNLSTEDKAIMRSLVQQIQNAPDADVVAQTRLLSELAFSGEIGAELADYQNGGEIDLLSRTKELQKKYGNLVTANNELFAWEDRSVEEILAANLDEAGLKLRCLQLQNAIKGLRGGDTIGVAAPVDAGKTSLLAAIAVDLAEQIKDNPDKYGDRHIQWLVNESVAARAVPRLYQAATHQTLSEIARDNASGLFLPKYLHKVGNTSRIRLKDAHSITMSQIETLVEETRPVVLIVDMVANIKGGTYDTEHQNLEVKWQFLRELGCEYDCIIIGTMQFSAEGYNILYPPLTALKQSKIGVQGALDLAIFMGRFDPQEHPELAELRGISTPKNKLAISGAGSLNQFELNFDGARCRFDLGSSPITKGV